MRFSLSLSFAVVWDIAARNEENFGHVCLLRGLDLFVYFGLCYRGYNFLSVSRSNALTRFILYI